MALLYSPNAMAERRARNVLRIGLIVLHRQFGGARPLSTSRTAERHLDFPPRRRGFASLRQAASDARGSLFGRGPRNTIVEISN